jgi:hypothetical protein
VLSCEEFFRVVGLIRGADQLLYITR